MCTGLSLRGSNHYFGRNLDLEYDFGPQVVITPRNFPFHFNDGTESDSHYAFVGMASVMDGVPLYADAVNEKGLGMAGLHFAMYASYPSAAPNADRDVAPYEFISWILSQCASLDEAQELLMHTRLVDVPFSPKVPNSKLHWMLSDATGSLVVEPMSDGLVIAKDPWGVLTNDPPFSYQTTNLNLYLNLTPETPSDRFDSDGHLVPLGKGTGAVGLPGDCSATSRFVRIAFNSANSICMPSEEAEITQFFHLLDSVASVRGDVRTEEGKYFYTRYSSCMFEGKYVYKTYKNNQMTAIDMHKTDLDTKEPTVYTLRESQEIFAGN